MTVRVIRRGSDGSSKTFAKTIKGVNGNTIEGSEYQRGWQRVETAVFDIMPGDQLTVGAHTSNGSNAWWGADHFQLTYVGQNEQLTGIVVPEPVKPEANVFYDLQGRRVLHPQRGIYICNGRKVWVK